MKFFYGNKVRFTDGEFKGKTGKILSSIPKLYTKEETVYRVLMDGFPIPGGWNGKVTITGGFLEKENGNHD